MDSSGGFLATVLERTRAYLDDASLDAKYNDAFLVRNIISPTFASIASRINNSTTNAISTWIPFPLTKGVAYYQIPPCVGEVWRLAVRNEDDWVSREAMPRTEWHYRGPNWKIEGNMLVFTPTPDQDYPDIEMQFMHNGEIQPFRLSSATLSAPGGSLDTLKFPLSTSPALGTIDRRENAYLGCVVRILTTTGIVEERIINTWIKDGTDWKITVRRPFVNYSAGPVTNVEIAPFGLESLYEAVAVGGAIKFGVYKKISTSHFQMLQLQYRDAMKTAMDHFSNKQMRTGKYFERSTADNSLNDWRNI